MTPKEKAKELVKKFTYCQRGFINTVSKQCALIAVDEIIDSYSEYKNMHDQEFLDADVKYWQQVKTEIKNL